MSEPGQHEDEQSHGQVYPDYPPSPSPSSLQRGYPYPAQNPADATPDSQPSTRAPGYPGPGTRPPGNVSPSATSTGAASWLLISVFHVVYCFYAGVRAGYGCRVGFSGIPFFSRGLTAEV